MDIISALKQGYRLLTVFEVMTWSAQPGRRDIFASYLKAMVKTKLLSSGWPKDCSTPESRREYLKEWEDRFGIVVDPKDITVNSSLRQLAKLLLVSLW